MSGKKFCGKCNKPKSLCKCWRPTKKTKETIDKLKSIFHIDWKICEACNFAWIDVTTYYDRLDKDPVFSQEMKQAQEYPFILARKWLFKNVKKENMDAIKEFLKKRDDRYKDRSRNEITGEDWEKLTINLYIPDNNR